MTLTQSTAEDMICSLAGMCDGANQIDGQGFSKFDSNLGKSLAQMALTGRPWTPKQAKVALTLINRYRRQLGGQVLVNDLQALATKYGAS